MLKTITVSIHINIHAILHQCYVGGVMMYKGSELREATTTLMIRATSLVKGDLGKCTGETCVLHM